MGLKEPLVPHLQCVQIVVPVPSFKPQILPFVDVLVIHVAASLQSCIIIEVPTVSVQESQKVQILLRESKDNILSGWVAHDELEKSLYSCAWNHVILTVDVDDDGISEVEQSLVDPIHQRLVNLNHFWRVLRELP